jgi:hypothetical protein
MKKTIFFGLLTVVILIFASCIPLDDLPDLGDDTDIYKPSSSELTGRWEFSFDFNTDIRLSEFDFNDELVVTFDFTESSLESKLNGEVNDFEPKDNNTMQDVIFDSFTIKSDGELSIIFNTKFNMGTEHNYYLTGTATNLNSGKLGNIYGTFTVDPEIYKEESSYNVYLVPVTFAATRVY